MEEEIKTPQQILQDAREEFEKKFPQCTAPYPPSSDGRITVCIGTSNEILSWHTAALQSFVEAEIEHLEEMKKEISKRCDDYSEKLDEKICFDDGFSEAIDDQITHLKELNIKKLKL